MSGCVEACAPMSDIATSGHYHISHKYEAELELFDTEVKSIHAVAVDVPRAAPFPPKHGSHRLHLGVGLSGDGGGLSS